MHFNRTTHYFNAVCEHRAGLNGINAKYDADLTKIEQYKGSEGYEKDKADIEKRRKEALAAFREKQAKAFESILDGMRTSAQSRTMTPPTPEQLALLQALKMRDKIGRDELEQAARTLKDCAVGLSVLDEIADKNEIRGARFGGESTASVMEHINDLAESAKRICALNRCNSRAEMVAKASIYNPEHDHNAMYSFRVDRDFLSEADAMAYLGGVNDMDSFRDAVNN